MQRMLRFDFFVDQKPFECDQCDQSFRQRQLLKRHQNLYHNPNYVPPEPKVSYISLLSLLKISEIKVRKLTP